MTQRFATTLDEVLFLRSEIERLRAALRELQRMGDEGMAPSYGEWLTFHAKVAKIAREALNEQAGK